MKKRMKLKKAGEEQRMDLLFFVVNVTNPDAVEVMQVEDQPAWAHEDNSSIVAPGFAKGDEVELIGLALHLTWLPVKPAPESGARNAGLMAVMKHIADKADVPGLMGQIGLGHLWGIMVTFNEP